MFIWMRLEKFVAILCSRQAAARVFWIRRPKCSRGLPHHRYKIGSRRRTPRTEISWLRVLLRRHEASELQCRDLVVHAAVSRLHREQPIKFPTDLVEKVRRRVIRFRNVELERSQLVGEM